MSLQDLFPNNPKLLEVSHLNPQAWCCTASETSQEQYKEDAELFGATQERISLEKDPDFPCGCVI